MNRRLEHFCSRRIDMCKLVPRISKLVSFLAMSLVLLYPPAGHAQSAQWTSAGNMTTARSLHTATLLNDGTVLVAGGYNSASIASAEVYNPSTNSWTVVGSMANARSNHTATLLSDGQVLVTGGDATGTSAELYNPSTQTWTVTGSMNASRYGHTASLLQNGMVLVAGGCCTPVSVAGYSEPIEDALSSSELWNPATGQWTLTGTMVDAQAFQTASVLSNGTVLVEGGTSLEFPPGPETISASEVYNPTSGTWAAVGNLNTARYYAAASLLTGNQVVVAGGNGGGCCSGLSSAELYNPTTQTWQQMPAMSVGAYSLAAAALSGGAEALVTGGYSCCSTPESTMNTAEIFTVVTQTWSLTASMTQARYAHTLTTLSDGTVLAAGGTVNASGQTSVLTSAERFYNGTPPPQVTITSNVATIEFSVTGSGCAAGSYITPTTLTWTAGADCTVTVSPSTPYVFAEWSDGPTANPRTFVAPSVSTTYSFTVTESTGNPASISSTSGSSQTATVGTAFASPLVATVQDSNGNAVSGATVTFSAPSSGASGAFAGGVQTATTNSSGVATSAAFTANTTAGSYTVTASVSGVSHAARFKLTNQASSGPASIGATSGTPQSAAVNTAFSKPLVVTVKNSSGSGVSGVMVTFTAPGSGASGTFAGGVSTATTNSSGVATSAIFTADGTAGTYAITASVTGVTNSASFTLTNTQGSAASIMATSGTPQSATINASFLGALVVTVENSSGTGVSGVTVTFTAPSSGASGTFAGGVKTATTNSSGVATSAVFTANSAAGSYTVTASVAGLSTLASFALTNTAGSPASITATAGTPQSATVSTSFGSGLTAAVKDSGGNAVSGTTVTFVAPGSGASGTFAGGLNTATTNSSGVATSALFTANATAGGYTVTASVSGVSTPASFALTNVPVGSTTSTITLVPSSYVTTEGSTGGQAVATSIDVLDESGTANTWNKYVEFDGLYSGYQIFTLPTSIAPAAVTNIQIEVNYQGPSTSSQTWTWQIYDWVHSTYVTVGTNAGAPEWGAWKILTFNIAGTLSDYVRSTDGQMRVQLVSNNSADSADIDYEAIIVSY
jgi:N-terminal glycosyl-hydrolase-114-associated domain/Bacterial Ig-like domain (group 1)/Galactose oxidase, central domain/Kelch motif